MANNMMNMQKMMKQAQKMQAQMEASQKELAATTFTGTEPSGMIKVTVTGDKKVEKIDLKPDVVDPDDIDMLQDLLLEATNDALSQVDAAQEKSFGGISKGLSGLGL